MPHSSNVAGTRASKKEARIQSTVGFPKKRSPTPYQRKTLFGRKSPTPRFIGAPHVGGALLLSSHVGGALLLSPHSRAKSQAMGVKHLLHSIETPASGTPGEISSLLYIATNAAMSPITIRTHSKKASPHHRSTRPTHKRPAPTEPMMDRLRSRSRIFQEQLSGKKELSYTSKNIYSSPHLNSEEKPVTPKETARVAPTTTASEEKILSPEIIRKAKQIPAVANPIKVYTQRVWLNDVIKAEDTPRRYPTEVFYGLTAQELAHYEETNMNNACYEFLHMLAHSFGGDFSRPNIVVGSRDANTIMTLYDHAAKYLLENKMCNYIDIKIECTLKPRKDGSGFTHHAKEIKLRYETNDGFIFYSPIIDADSIERPTVQMGEEIIALLTLHYTAYKSSLENTKNSAAVQKSSTLELPLYTEKPDPKQKSLLSYFTSESKETTAASQETSAVSQKPARKRKRKSDIITNYKITAFFPIATENQENRLPDSQTVANEPSVKRTRKNSPAPLSAFFTLSSTSENVHIPAITPSIRVGN